MAEVKILHLDIERSPILATIWDLWDLRVGIDQLMNDSEILSCAMSWEGEDKVEFVAAWKGGRRNMLKRIHKRLEEADAVVTYNGDRFDLKVLNMEFAYFGLGPPAPYKSVDLLKTVKRRFKLTSNKLDYALRYFKLGAKMKTPGHQLWLDVMDGKKEAQDIMEEYNIRDVVEMKKLFTFLKGWGIIGMPNLSAYAREECCPECGSKHYQRRGMRITNVYRYPRYQCMAEGCGHWFKGNKAFHEDRPPLMAPIR